MQIQLTQPYRQVGDTGVGASTFPSTGSSSAWNGEVEELRPQSDMLLPAPAASAAPAPFMQIQLTQPYRNDFRSEKSNSLSHSHSQDETRSQNNLSWPTRQMHAPHSFSTQDLDHVEAIGRVPDADYFHRATNSQDSVRSRSSHVSQHKALAAFSNEPLLNGESPWQGREEHLLAMQLGNQRKPSGDTVQFV